MRSDSYKIWIIILDLLQWFRAKYKFEDGFIMYLLI